MAQTSDHAADAPERDGAVAFSAAGLQAFVTAALERAGVPPAGAETVAASLVDADLRGIHSHGVTRTGIYLERLRLGGNVARAEVSVIAQAPALTLLDGANVLGQIASARAVEIALEQAASVGAAAVCVRNGSHFGATGYWTRRIAQAGCLGLASTNGTPLMVPWGSVAAAMGTNPLAMAFPSSGAAPVVVDFATSETTWGALLGARAAGAEIPRSWALDGEGNPTSDATVAVAAGRLMPFGRHKGSALAVGVELLSGALAGAQCLSAVADMYGSPELPNGLGHFFLAVDPSVLGDAGAHFADAVHAVQVELNGLPAAPGVERVLWPGQPEAECAAERLRTGIPLPEATVADLEAVARATGVDLSSARFQVG